MHTCLRTRFDEKKPSHCHHSLSLLCFQYKYTHVFSLSSTHVSTLYPSISLWISTSFPCFILWGFFMGIFTYFIWPTYLLVKIFQLFCSPMHLFIENGKGCTCMKYSHCCKACITGVVNICPCPTLATTVPMSWFLVGDRSPAQSTQMQTFLTIAFYLVIFSCLFTSHIVWHYQWKKEIKKHDFLNNCFLSCGLFMPIYIEYSLTDQWKKERN